MVLLVILIGLVWMSAGITFMIRPDAMKEFLNYWKQGSKLYSIGFIRLMFGGILFLAAPYCTDSITVAIIGGIVFVIGTIALVFDLNNLKSIVSWWDEKADSFIRLVSFIPFLLGLLVLYSV